MSSASEPLAQPALPEASGEEQTPQQPSATETPVDTTAVDKLDETTKPDEDTYDPSLKTSSGSDTPKGTPAAPVAQSLSNTSTQSANSLVSDTPPSLPKKPDVTSSPSAPNDQLRPSKPSSRGKSPTSGGKRKRDDTSHILERLEEKIKVKDTRSTRHWDQYLRYVEAHSQFEAITKAYERAVTEFPYASDFWIRYIKLQLDHSEFQQAEQLFARCLTKIPSVRLWSLYLEYILRINNSQTGGDNARSVITDAYEFALNHIGIDRDSGPIWADYIDFINSKNTQTTWEQQQQMDLIRKTYRRAVCIPLSNLEALWHAYNHFENGIGKTTARKFLAEKSQAYMTARSASKEMSKFLEGLSREGAPLYNRRRFAEIRESQIKKWFALIDWEKSNPLGLEVVAELQKRVKYAYQQAATTLWFYADLWFEAADYSLEATPDSIADGVDLLKIGLQAAPLSFLLNYKLAEVYESNSKTTECKETYTTFISKLKEKRTTMEIQQKELYEELGLPLPTPVAAANSDTPTNGSTPVPSEGDSEPTANALPLSTVSSRRNANTSTGSANNTSNQARLNNIQKQLDNQARIITTAYTAFMKSVKRTEGIAQSRAIFSECRRLSYATYLIYVTSAMMESHNGRPDIATKIFEIGLKRYGSAEYISEYLEFLILINDDTNARALFETSIKKLDTKDAKILYQQFLQYEAEFGELSAVLKLETRYRSLYPEETALEMFSERNEIPKGSRRSSGRGTSSTSRAGSSGVSRGLRVNSLQSTALLDISDVSDEEDDDDEPTIPGGPSAYNNRMSPVPSQPQSQQQQGHRRQAKKSRHEDNSAKYNAYMNNNDYDGSTISTNVMNVLKALPPAQTFTLPQLDPVRLVSMLRDVPIPESLLR